MKTSTHFPPKAMFKISFGNATDKAFETVTDLMQYPAIHPYIEDVKVIQPNLFLCYEKTRILFISYRFSYTVRVLHDKTHFSVMMHSEVQKGIFLHLTFWKDEAEQVPAICEHIEISGPKLVRAMLLRKVRRAHKKMYENLKALIESAENRNRTPQIPTI